MRQARGTRVLQPFEWLESRRLMSVVIPSGYVYVETVVAPASNSAKTGPELVESINPLVNDASYFVRAVGKYQLAHSPVRRYGDAGFYQHRDPPYAWTPSVRGTNLRVDGVTNWGTLDPVDNHYGAYITGNGATLETQILTATIPTMLDRSVLRSTSDQNSMSRNCRMMPSKAASTTTSLATTTICPTPATIGWTATRTATPSISKTRRCQLRMSAVRQ